ncbi:MAG: hypothetical protein H6818_20615 [Phycisphaerales bacterium]|nr:hypothetical protein [Phycisphaerales bacterium]
MGDKVRQLLEQLKRDVAAQKGKAAGLGLLLLILLVAVGRLFLTGDSTKEVAAAPLVPAAAAPAVVEPTPTAPTNPPARTAGVPTAAISGDTGNLEMEPRKRNLSGLPRTLARDPFRNPSWIRPIRKDDGEEVAQDSWLKRLSEQWSDYQAKADAVEELVDQKISELQLQSTMIGPASSAYISGRLVHVGDEIDGFSVVNIENRRVTLSFSGVVRSLTAP